MFSFSCKPFSSLDIDGKGKGLIATRRIKMGEKVLTERPILLIRNNEHSKFDSWAENIVNLVKDLPQEKMKKFLELADNEYFDKTSEFLYLKGVKKLRCNVKYPGQQQSNYFRLLFKKTITWAGGRWGGCTALN